MRESISGWQRNLAEGFSSSVELLSFLNLPISLANERIEKQFKTRVPRGFAERMEMGNPNDPLLLQVLAVENELETIEGFSLDPLLEKSANPLPGLIHKYQGRVLLTLAGACAVHCRYCFRRHFPYKENNPGRDGWQPVIDYIANNVDIHEVILSGGDPLLVSDIALATLLERLAEIPHLQSMRFHSRIPVVLPERIDSKFIKLLAGNRLQKVMVIHSNHPQEIDENVHRVCQLLRETNCHLLNQSVLLAKINDNASVLARLSERLFACGILPYYLHLLDRVQGVAHFETPLDKALDIFRELQTMLPGYLVPRLVREEAGQRSKVLIAP